MIDKRIMHTKAQIRFRVSDPKGQQIGFRCIILIDRIAGFTSDQIRIITSRIIGSQSSIRIFNDLGPRLMDTIKMACEDDTWKYCCCDARRNWNDRASMKHFFAQFPGATSDESDGVQPSTVHFLIKLHEPSWAWPNLACITPRPTSTPRDNILSLVIRCYTSN